MTPFSKLARAQLALNTLEDRATPATAVYAAASQTLTITAAQGDMIDVAALAGQPTGYLQVTETQSSAMVFSSSTASHAVRNLVVKFGNVQSGQLTLDGGVQLGGNLKVSGAQSSQTVVLLGTVSGSVIYTANVLPAFDTFEMESSAVVGRNLTLNLGEGSNTARIMGGVVHGNVAIKGGASDDTVEFTACSDVTIDGSATVNLGSGNNTVLGKGPNGIAFTVQVGANFTYLGGTGNDHFDFDISGTSLNVGRDAKFILGTPLVFDGNSVSLEALRAGRNINFVGGLGSDNVEISGAFEAKGNVMVALGAGDNTFDSNFDGIGTNSIAGSFVYAGGTGGDVINLDAMTIGKNLNVMLGESSGSTQGVFVGTKSPAGVTIYGAAYVTGGSGADGVIFRRAYIGNSLTVRTGAGDDTVAFDDLNVAGNTLFDLGVGSDSLLGEMQTSDSAGSLSNATTFGGKFIVKGGDGDDTVNLSNDGDSTTLIKFGGQVVLQGGNGVDTLQNAAENFFMVTGNFNDLEVLTGTAIV